VTAIATSGLAAARETAVPSPTPFSYTVTSGDTLGQIAEKFHVALDSLLAANPKIDPNAMPVGHTLIIPASPDHQTGQVTPTAAAIPVEQTACHPTADGGLWCFVLIRNDGTELIEDVSAQVSLVDPAGRAIASQTALLPLDIVRPDQSLPLAVFFSPEVPSDLKPQVRILTAIQAPAGDPRYLPAAVQNALVRVDWLGLSAQLTGEVTLPVESKLAGVIWVAAVAYDGAGNVIGVRRWESSASPSAGGSLPFSFMVSSVAGKIQRVEFFVEARAQ
jgi:LysM repeat protein